MGDVGFWRAFSETWKGASLHPSRFFQELGPYPSLWPSFLFAFLILGLDSVFSSLWAKIFTGSMGEEAGLFFWGPLAPPLFSPIWILPNLLSTAIGIWIFAGVVHLGAMIVGAGSKGFATTFRTVAFSLAPMLLGILPGAGFFAIIWVYAVLITGLRWTQETTPGRAALAVFFPFVALGLLTIVVFAVAAIFIALS